MVSSLFLLKPTFPPSSSVTPLPKQMTGGVSELILSPYLYPSVHSLKSVNYL